jgi:hypothetical protein
MLESTEIETTFGYLSAIESAEHGYFGGYLVVSPWGRPLEFHCTAPVVPNRAQRILYGATLSSYLLGEQIGGTLLSAAKITPCVILTDQADFGLLRQKVAIPLVHARSASAACDATPSLCEPEGSGVSASTLASIAQSQEHPLWCGRFRARDCLLELPYGYESDHATVASLLRLFHDRVDLMEPFERIHEAIREAQRIDERSQGIHGQAA